MNNILTACKGRMKTVHHIQRLAKHKFIIFH